MGGGGEEDAKGAKSWDWELNERKKMTRGAGAGGSHDTGDPDNPVPDQPNRYKSTLPPVP